MGAALYFAAPSFVPPAAPHAATAAPEKVQRWGPLQTGKPISQSQHLTALPWNTSARTRPAPGGTVGLGATAAAAAAAIGSVAAVRNLPRMPLEHWDGGRRVQSKGSFSPRFVKNPAACPRGRVGTLNCIFLCSHMPRPAGGSQS